MMKTTCIYSGYFTLSHVLITLFPFALGRLDGWSDIWLYVVEDLLT